VKRIGILEGDGVGREVVPAAQRVLEAVGAPFTYVPLDAGWQTFIRTGNALPQTTVDTLRNCDGALLGAVNSPSHKVEGYSSPVVALRKELDLYANVRPIISAPVVSSRPGINMLLVRENTECLYVKQEWLEDEGDTAVAQRIITRAASERIARTAFAAALSRSQRKPPRVTIVHKANVLSVSDGLFRSACMAVADDYPAVEVEEQLVDSMIYRLILEPERYDVVVAPNLYGDILSDGAAALVGGLGLAPSANMGDAFVLAEPVHGSAPDIAGRGIANPTATILAAALLLDALRLEEHARRIRRAVDATLRAGCFTRDLGGNLSTCTFTNAVIERLV
jgi:homoisocitrate dehydrogenase